MKRHNFYRREPMRALEGMIGLTLEERGVYGTIIDLLYTTWRPLEDNRQYIAGWCGCAVQKLNPIVERLVAKGKLLRVQDGARWVLTNDHFEDERLAVKGAGNGRYSRKVDIEPQAEVGEKSEEVGEKSAEVGENSTLLDHKIDKIQLVAPIDKSRIDQNRLEYITTIDAGAHVDPNDWARMLAEATAAAGDQLDHTSPGVKHAADLRALVEPQSGEPCLWSEVIAAIGMVRTRSARTRKPIRSWSWIRDDAIRLRDIRLSADMPGVNQSNIIGGGYDGFNGNRAATPTVGETRRAGAALALDRLRSSQSGGDDDGGGYPRLAVIS